MRMDIAALRQTLQDPTLYPEPTASVEVRETHISLVFLTDDYAYKIKKPVNLGFLDFSTIDRRRFYCEQELILNRRLSSGVYLGIVTLRGEDQHYTFGERGQVIEYALKMRRLPADRSLEVLLQHDEVTPEMIQGIAQRLAVFHAEHALPKGSESFGTLEQVRADWEENFAQTADAIGRSLSRSTYTAIEQAVTRFMGRHAGWFVERVQEGRIRDCHGDLRAEHIYFEPDQMQIIDCIEFNQRFRYIDVSSEVAFLAVDLERLGFPKTASSFVRAYVQDSNDVSLYRLLDFYRCYRAYVRGKVTSIRLHTASSTELRAQLERRAHSYYELAARYAKRLTQPVLILMMGIIASGKSTVAEGIAKALDLERFSSDRVRKELAGVAPETHQQLVYGTGLYHATMTRRTYDALADMACQVLGRGDSVVLDASFAKQAERRRMAQLAREMGAHCCLIECYAPETVLRARLRQRAHSPASISDAREGILDQFQRDYEPLSGDEGIWCVPLDTTQNLEECLQQALAAIQERKP
jgi:uncharacterized protein